MAWLEEAAWVAKCQKHLKIKGEFAAMIVLSPPDKRLIDIDNRVKVVLDLVQRVGLVENDCLCRLLIVSYGVDEPVGARIVLAPMNSIFSKAMTTTASVVAKAS